MCSTKQPALPLAVLLLQLLLSASHIRGDVNTTRPLVSSSSPNATSGLSPQHLVEELAQVCDAHVDSVPAWLAHTCSQATKKSMIVDPTMLHDRQHLPSPLFGQLNISRRHENKRHTLEAQVGQLSTNRRSDGEGILLCWAVGSRILMRSSPSPCFLTPNRYTVLQHYPRIEP